MLIRNESKVKHSIDIKLVFDDNTIKELEIHEGDCVHVSYKRNDCVKCGVGVIRKIKPIIRAKFSCCDSQLSESASITIDMSENNMACVDKFELDDIIDIKILYPCCCQIPNTELPQCPCIKSPKDPECTCKPSVCPCESDIQYSCVTGSALTNRGVIAHG